MPDVEITPELRAQARAVAEQCQDLLPGIIGRVKDGRVDWTDIMWIAAAMTKFATAVAPVIAAEGMAGEVAVTSEIVDVYSGNDPGAIINLPGIPPDKLEPLLDAAKPIQEHYLFGVLSNLSKRTTAPTA